MRNNYLLAALITLIVLSCKKETEELTGDPPAVSTDDYTICTGSNTWDNDVTFVGDRAYLQVVYNNKVYFFQNNYYLSLSDPRRFKISIYDGTSWQIISSDIPFEPLSAGFAFVIGNKGYFGYTQYLGSSAWQGDSYEYNFTTNTWRRIEDFPGYYVAMPAYFTVGNKGYVVGGDKSEGSSKETWEFDPTASPKWRKRADIPVGGRFQSEGFSIGNKGYIVGGRTYSPDYSSIYYKTLLEYNPASNTWVTKASFPGVARADLKSFVIGGNAYVGAGRNSETHFIDFYKYDPADNDWTHIPDYSAIGELRQAFALNSKGYAVWTPNYQQPYRLKKYTPRLCTTISTGGTTIP